jgi:hypothetical protein
MLLSGQELAAQVSTRCWRTLPFDVLRIPSPCCCGRGEGLKISPQVSPEPLGKLGTGKTRRRVACRACPELVEGKPEGRTSRHVGEKCGPNRQLSFVNCHSHRLPADDARHLRRLMTQLCHHVWEG